MLNGLKQDHRKGQSKEDNLRRVQEINPTKTRNLVFLNAMSVRDMVTFGLTVET
jgi:hypothetical protein